MQRSVVFIVSFSRKSSDFTEICGVLDGDFNLVVADVDDSQIVNIFEIQPRVFGVCLPGQQIQIKVTAVIKHLVEVSRRPLQRIFGARSYEISSSKSFRSVRDLR